MASCSSIKADVRRKLSLIVNGALTTILTTKSNAVGEARGAVGRAVVVDPGASLAISSNAYLTWPTTCSQAGRRRARVLSSPRS